MPVCTIASTSLESFELPSNENEPSIILFKRILTEAIWECHRNGVTDFFINCEIGVPLWAGEIICGLKKYNEINLHIVVPYENQSVNWHESLRDRYYRVHEAADTVKFASKDYSDTCYQATDELMIDESNFVLIIANSPEQLYAASYAIQNEIPVKYIDISP